MSEPVDLYDNIYGDFGSRAEAAVRAEAFGEDIGQSSWMTAQDWLRFADQAQVRSDSDVLEIGSGSGGPAVYLATVRGCRVTGIDVNENGVHNAAQLAKEKGVADRVTFYASDAAKPLPFDASSFDAVLSNDAMCHIANRVDVLREWHRVLRPGGRMVFTDAMIVSGFVSNEEIAVRSSIGWYLFLPPGVNEELIARAGFTLLSSEDLTESAEVIARRWHDARERYRDDLVAREGEVNFDGLQRFLSSVHRLSAEHRLSRYCYLAEKSV
jgi:SAM-dependent methyltransferase